MRTVRITKAYEKQIPETFEECQEVVTCYNCAYFNSNDNPEDCSHRVVLKFST